jgi:hypothetical protein
MKIFKRFLSKREPRQQSVESSLSPAGLSQANLVKIPNHTPRFKSW